MPLDAGFLRSMASSPAAAESPREANFGRLPGEADGLCPAAAEKEKKLGNGNGFSPDRAYFLSAGCPCKVAPAMI
ncbi:MAG TPA: hypothetical protein DCP22_02265 [Ruminococcaceae bacterium]|nr:hypothetical protein [Oscillospiraceae bacterium]